MLHRILYNVDDSVMIMSPNPNVRLKGETEIEQLERFYQRHTTTHPQHSGLSHEDMKTTALPSDRVNRAKWRKKLGGGIMIDNTIVTPAELREADKTALDVENKKAQPDMKVALDLLLKLQENKY
jgi:hypothetical protein